MDIKSNNSRQIRYAAVGLIVLGILTLGISSSYYAYVWLSMSKLESLNYESPILYKSDLRTLKTAPVKSNVPKTYTENEAHSPPVGLGPKNNSDSTFLNPLDPDLSDQRVSRADMPAATAQSLKKPFAHQTMLIHPKFWSDPYWSDGEYYDFDPGDSQNENGALPTGYQAIKNIDRPIGHPPPIYISIPSVKISSNIEPLGIIDLNNSLSYETPKKIVGHIPESANPGEQGNLWLFGHLESPIKGEGNVFRRLPDIPDLLREGDPVYVEVENNTGQIYLYVVTKTQIIHHNEFDLYNSEASTITLVACVPKLVYDHRILVTGTLVGVKNR